MAKKFKPYTQPTVDAVVTAGKNLSISEETLSYKTSIIDEKSDQIKIQYYNVITKYYHIMKPYIEKITLSEDEYYRYKFKPNLYCYEIYGTPELMTSLLYINNMISVTEFSKQTIYRFDPDMIMKIINELMTLNEKELKKNRIDTQISNINQVGEIGSLITK